MESQLANSLDRHSKLSLLHYVIMKSMALGEEAVRAQCERVTQADRTFAVQVAQTRAEMASISDMDFEFEVEAREQRRAQRRMSLEMWNVQSIQEEPSGDTDTSGDAGSDIEAEILGLPEENDEDEEEGFHVDGIIDEPQMLKKKKDTADAENPANHEKSDFNDDSSEEVVVEKQEGDVSIAADTAEESVQIVGEDHLNDSDSVESEESASNHLESGEAKYTSPIMQSETESLRHTPSDTSVQDDHASSYCDDEDKQSNRSTIEKPEEGSDSELVDDSSETDVGQVVSDELKMDDKIEESTNEILDEEGTKEGPKTTSVQAIDSEAIKGEYNAMRVPTEEASAHTDTEPDFTDAADLIRTPGSFDGQQLDQVIEYDEGILNPTQGDNFDDDDVSYSKSDDLLSKGGLSSTLSRQSSDDEDDPSFLLPEPISEKKDAQKSEKKPKKESRKKDKSESKKDKKNRRRSLSTSRHSKSDEMSSSKHSRRRSLSTSRHSKASDLNSSKHSRRRSLSTSRHSKSNDISSSKNSKERRKSRSRSLSTSRHSVSGSESEADAPLRRGRRPKVKTGDESKRRRRSIEIDETGNVSKEERPLKTKSELEDKAADAAGPDTDDDAEKQVLMDESKKTKKSLKTRRGRSRSLSGESSADEPVEDDAKAPTRGRKRPTTIDSKECNKAAEEGIEEKSTEKTKKSSSSRKSKKSSEKSKKVDL